MEGGKEGDKKNQMIKPRVIGREGGKNACLKNKM
jgi:hypothetical protein